MDAKGIWNTAIARTNYSSTYKVMKRPNRKEYSSHQAWVAAMDKFNAAKPKRKDYKSHAAWVAAIDKFNQNSKKVFKKPEVKSHNKTDYNVSTDSGKKAYENALKNKNKKNNTTLKINKKENTEEKKEVPESKTEKQVLKTEQAFKRESSLLEENNPSKKKKVTQSGPKKYLSLIHI